MDNIETLRNGKSKIVKKLVKKGTVKIDVVETTPVVWKGELLRFEWERTWNKAAAKVENGAYHFIKMSDESEMPYFAYDHSFGCCYAENDIMYVHGIRGGGGGGNIIDVFWSDDLLNWQTKCALEFPEDIHLYNTSVCKGKDGYVMAIEIGGENPIVGVQYTIVFATSKNLFDWELMDMNKYIYDPTRYTACPSIRYFDGYYYMVSLEEMPFYRCVPYITRTKDFSDFEVAIKNPFMFFDDDDKKIINISRFSKEEIEYIKDSPNNNNSDVDFCEYNGKTIITYSWGNQLGNEFLGIAEYDGTLEEFLKSYF